METENKLKNDTFNLDSAHYVHELFESVAIHNAGNIAVAFGNETLTYGELNDKANLLSYTILTLAPDAEIIGISTTRSVDMVIGVIAILKSGKAYLPLDPSYPESRLKQIISDSGISWCIAPASKDIPLFKTLGVNPLELDSSSEKIINTFQKSGLAYVLYTSGSTGQPKGVCMGHAALVNLLKWQERNSNAGKDTCTLQFAPLSFDVSFQEIFSTLSTGGTLVLIDDHMRLDPLALLHLINEKNISRLFLPFVALQYLSEMAVSFKLFPACLKEIITAGEQLKITPQVETFFQQLSDCTLSNQYGPTECHVVSELKLTGASAVWPKLPNIGKPIDNVDIFILDDNLQLVHDGKEGELCIAGVCLADGYLHQKELTSEKFIEWPHPEKGTLRLYRTGDLAKYLPNKEIEFLGRKDQQVKIRGNRIELGEIEVVLTNQSGVKQAAVVADENTIGEKRLVAYLISDSNSKDANKIKNKLLELLPEYMVPSHYIWLDEFPKTSSGKIDRKALPKPEFSRPELATVYKKPVTITEKNIAGIWMDVLQMNKIGLDDNFFELGGNSLLSQRTVTLLKNRFNLDLPITKLYQFPTIAGIAAFLSPELKTKSAPVRKTIASDSGSPDIAVIGMAGRFPGADSIDELWELLKDGKETIRFFTKDELDKSIPDNIKNDPEYVPARGILNDVVNFDAAFFGINPRLAELMDPQQRVFLEIAWEVLEKSGYSPQKYDGITGVFAGTGNNTYYPNNVQSNSRLIEAVGGFQVMTVNEKDYVSSRTAYELNLKGPAVSVFSGCSTSHLAIAQAVDSIRRGTCDIAVAGGVSITSPVNSGHIYQEGAMLSADGHCRPFDDIAGGTVFSDGAGVVLLKNLKSAQEDGDTIYAIIKGIGVNNDGAGKGSFTAPSADGQAGAIRMAIDESGIDPSDISYIEAHGTGTPLGDPIEIEGLKMAFGEQDKTQYCAIGSVKGNIGHLTAAAGVTGLIKTCLALYHKKIPASIGYDKPNHNIDFLNSPFYVNNKFSEWKADGLRRAGVSSFGVGGTNVHILLEESSHPEDIVSADNKSRPFQLITWSAKSVVSRDLFATKLAGYIRQNEVVPLADIAYSLQKYRTSFNNRRFVVASSSSDFLNQLLLENVSGSESGTLLEAPGEIVFSFPGQGAQYLNMGKELYTGESVYKEAIDTCAEILEPYLKCDIRDIIYPSKSDAAAEEVLKNTRYTQPAIFITEYALSKLWMSWGIQPSILCGHSIGEFVAAHLAGVFSLEDALKLIATRGLMVSELPKGSMLSVRLAVDELNEILPQSLSVAAINNRKLCVVAGTDENIAMFSQQLDKQEIPNKVLVTSHAFHSSMMDPIIEGFKKVVSTVQLNKLQKPVVSTVNGTWLKDEQAVDPQYWADHLRKTVRFADALDTIAELDKPLFIEVGPGNVTSTLARQQVSGNKIKVVTSLERSETISEYFTLLKAVGQVWLNGAEPDWDAFYANQNRRKTLLPTYAFDKKPCWVEPQIKTNNESINFNNYLYNNEAANESEHQSAANTLNMRKETLFSKIKQLLEDASGIEMTHISPNMSFLEIGLDSLLLTQVAITFKKEFGLPITFRQLNESYGSPALLIEYLDANLPKEAFESGPQTNNTPLTGNIPAANLNANSNEDPSISLIAQQIQLLANQVAMMQNNQKNVSTVTPVNQNSMPGKAVPNLSELSPEEAEEIKKPFGATARIEKQKTELTPVQETFLKNLTERYNKKTGQSKAYAQNNRAHMSDPRVVSGFKPLTKEIVYPIVVNKSKGSRLWDIEGNEYIDALNGFGASMLGHQPDFIKKAVMEQVEKGYEVGPQHELAGEVTSLICELTGHDRSALCSTGSEAVLGTMRIARTVTGRSLIVAFSGSYHGIVDEVIVRGTKKLKSFPAAPGIMPEAVQNMLILDYGTDESLRIIKERAHEIAAVLVEPVQSRRPEFVPVEFLKKVRHITAEAGAALIFDEVITGFRMHPGGAQALFGIKADIASYGKVVGAGIPIGVIAGKKEFMDALDGGFWQYGDESYPEIGVTYFAGTFVRHPLALASAKAALSYMKLKGPELQNGINQKARHLADTMNKVFEDLGLSLYVAQFGSLWKIKYKEEIPYSELLFTLMREKGIHIWDGFPCFMTEAHTEQEVNTIINCFKESVNEMIEGGFFSPVKSNSDLINQNKDITLNPPVPGARLGRDQNGNPAWFVMDPDQPGKYLKLNIG